MVNEVPERLWTYLIANFITKLSLVVEKDAILVVYNRLFRMTYFITITEEITVEKLVRLFKDNVWKLHGLPESVILDRELQFAVELTKELDRILDIKTKLLTSFNLQIDS